MMPDKPAQYVCEECQSTSEGGQCNCLKGGCNCPCNLRNMRGGLRGANKTKSFGELSPEFYEAHKGDGNPEWNRNNWEGLHPAQTRALRDGKNLRILKGTKGY